MKCLKCGCQLENDDNFCPNCGHWTARGYNYFNNSENVNKIMNGYEIKQGGKLSILISLISFGLILFIGMVIFRGNNLFKPIIFLKKEFDSYLYGYRTSIMKTDNTYDNVIVNDINDAYSFIKRDFDSQTWKCMHDIETYKIEEELEEKYLIASVNFCDISYDEVLKIKSVIDKMYNLFPNIELGLTNITISNAKTKSEYIAYFQPMNQFVNSNEDINIYNRINKTQILLNSYYFLNKDILKNDITSVVGENFYVNDATWESTIAHEFGHYITFMLFLNKNNFENITLVNKDNEEIINELMNEYDNGSFSRDIVNEALQNYNNKYNLNVDLETFASSISDYASVKDNDGNIIFDETIAEAIHDYYLHLNNCKPESFEIVYLIKTMLYGDINEKMY